MSCLWKQIPAQGFHLVQTLDPAQCLCDPSDSTKVFLHRENKKETLERKWREKTQVTVGTFSEALFTIQSPHQLIPSTEKESTQSAHTI